MIALAAMPRWHQQLVGINFCVGLVLNDKPFGALSGRAANAMCDARKHRRIRSSAFGRLIVRTSRRTPAFN